MKFSSIVPLNIKKETSVIDYLCARFTYHSRQDWEEVLKSGKISIENKNVDGCFIVMPGSTIVYDAGEFDEPPANLNYRIIYEDEWFIGIDKPGNLLVHRAGRSFRNNLMYQLRFNNVPPFPHAHPTHRLDRDTSGVVLVAKDAQARTAMSSAFADHKVNKQYQAVVHGVAEKGTIIDAPIAKAQQSAISYKFQVDPSGKEAVTEILDVVPIGDRFSLLTLKPLTGRTHQIRIHCAFTGHLIVGDKLYGLSEPEYLKWRDEPSTTTAPMLFYRHALHCSMIEFIHPFDNRIVRIETPLPQDMQDLISTLHS
ncbi:MAG TPA: RluA family pseudouridine synthase [Chitinispirillaceae bacterium]|nr:RluA family pseudouridine synthase [Chitinispirillaceae bacterium]